MLHQGTRWLPRRPGYAISRYARYHMAGGMFPVGLSSFRLLTAGILSQAGPLGGWHRASPVPFRGSSCTSRLHPLDATPQRLIPCLIQGMEFSTYCIITLRGGAGDRGSPIARCGSFWPVSFEVCLPPMRSGGRGRVSHTSLGRPLEPRHGQDLLDASGA
jgi:hypothetical protein